MNIMLYLGRGVRLWRARHVVIVLALLGGVLVLSACGARNAKPAEADLQATVEALVNAKLTETASSPAEGEQAQDGTPEAPEAAGDKSASTGLPALITPTPDQSAEIMDFLVANTRHFKGDPNAPVTIIEFGDFQ